MLDEVKNLKEANEKLTKEIEKLLSEWESQKNSLEQSIRNLSNQLDLKTEENMQMQQKVQTLQSDLFQVRFSV